MRRTNEWKRKHKPGLGSPSLEQVLGVELLFNLPLFLYFVLTQPTRGGHESENNVKFSRYRKCPSYLSNIASCRAYHSEDLIEFYRSICKLIRSADSKVENYSRNRLNLIAWFVTFFAACTTQRGLNVDSLAKIICFGSEAFQWLDSRATLRFLTLLLSASLAILSWMRHFGMHIGTSNEACPSCKLRTSMAWVALHSGKDGKASSRKRLKDKLFSRIMMSTSWPHCSAVLRRLICPLLVMTSRISAERWPRKEVLVFFKKSCMNNRNVCWNWTYDKDFELLFCTGIECSFSTRWCKRFLARHHNLSFRKQDTKCAKKDRKFDLENAEHLICTLTVVWLFVQYFLMPLSTAIVNSNRSVFGDFTVGRMAL